MLLGIELEGGQLFGGLLVRAELAGLLLGAEGRHVFATVSAESDGAAARGT